MWQVCQAAAVVAVLVGLQEPWGVRAWVVGGCFVRCGQVGRAVRIAVKTPQAVVLAAWPAGPLRLPVVVRETEIGTLRVWVHSQMAQAQLSGSALCPPALFCWQTAARVSRAQHPGPPHCWVSQALRCLMGWPAGCQSARVTAQSRACEPGP